MDGRRAMSCGKSLVSSLHRSLRDEEVAGSTPVTPTTKGPGQEHLAELRARVFLILPLGVNTQRPRRDHGKDDGSDRGAGRDRPPRRPPARRPAACRGRVCRCRGPTAGTPASPRIRRTAPRGRFGCRAETSLRQRGGRSRRLPPRSGPVRGRRCSGTVTGARRRRWCGAWQRQPERPRRCLHESVWIPCTGTRRSLRRRC
jgi:hypothetical protein